MAYLFEEGFELGTKGAFDGTEIDSGNRLFYPGPRQLMMDGYRIAPFRGGGLMQISFEKSSADAYVPANTAFNVTGTSTIFFRMMVLPYMLNLASEVDVFSIFRGLKAGPATEYEAKIAWHEPEGLVLELQGNRMPLDQNRWICIEGEVKAGSGGFVKLYVEGSTLAWTPATVAAITGFQLGVLGQAGSITQGAMCFDEIFVHGTRLFPPQGPRDALSLDGAPLRMRKPGFAFVGTGEMLSVQLIGETGVDNKVKIYDTMTPTFAEDDLVEMLTATVAGMTKINQRILRFQRGAWIEPSGTDPLVVLQLGQIGEADYFGDFINAVEDDDDDDE